MHIKVTKSDTHLLALLLTSKISRINFTFYISLSRVRTASSPIYIMHNEFYINSGFLSLESTKRDGYSGVLKNFLAQNSTSTCVNRKGAFFPLCYASKYLTPVHRPRKYVRKNIYNIRRWFP